MRDDANMLERCYIIVVSSDVGLMGQLYEKSRML